jgi:hypothetical protein
MLQQQQLKTKRWQKQARLLLHHGQRTSAAKVATR